MLFIRSATTVEAFVHQSSGGYKFHSESSPRVTWSSAGYQSRCPFGDINVFQVCGLTKRPTNLSLHVFHGAMAPLAAAAYSMRSNSCLPSSPLRPLAGASSAADSTSSLALFLITSNHSTTINASKDGSCLIDLSCKPLTSSRKPWLQADKHHILAAVISCSPTAQGGRYLQRHLQRELHHQIKHQGGNIQAALPAALRALNEAFRDMHPFNGPVLEGVKLTLAYMDAKTKVRLILPPIDLGYCNYVIFLSPRILLLEDCTRSSI